MKTIQFRAMMLIPLLLAVISLGMSNAQTINVSGKVTDAADQTLLLGCSVFISGTSKGVCCDLEGNYTIKASMNDSLIFSYIGYKTVIKKVTAPKMDVTLEPEQCELQDIVISSCNIKATKMITGCVATYQEEKNEALSYSMAATAYDTNSEEYKPISENGFKRVAEAPLSTFSIDVDAASYSNMRRFINDGELPPADAVRVEELINYFTYDYPKPTGNEPVRVTSEVGNCPWNAAHRLVRIGLKAKEIPTGNLPASNLVFLIDVSGSMEGPEGLDLVKSSLKLLVNNLREKDRVAIVIYSGAAGLKLESTPGSDKQKIKDAIDDLEAEGSTAGGEGIRLAYKIARKNFMKDGNNRIILCTDGDFNVGVSSENELEQLIEKERKSGVFLTVLGYGMGNYKDNTMQTLAEKGNGNQAYIDNLQEANRVLVNEFGATLYAVAKDVKLQVEFNPSQVQAYRLVGYESRLLADEDFNNDAKDAGELGAGHTVTAFYEVIPVGVKNDYVGKMDDLKYQKEKNSEKSRVSIGSGELLTVKLRYKLPDKDTSDKLEIPLVDTKKDDVSPDFRFASAVAMFGQLVRDSNFKGDATFDKVINLAKQGLINDNMGYRREFIRMAELAKGLH